MGSIVTAVAMPSDPALMAQMEAEEFVGRAVSIDGATFTTEGR